MLRSILAPRSQRTWLATCASLFIAAACSSNAGYPNFGSGAGPADAGSGNDGAGGSGSSSGSRSGSGSGSGSGSSSSSGSSGADAGSDSGNADAAAPPPPSCQAGDRTEWSGTIPNTVISVAVCSGCGESYVVASNGSASTAQVTMDNGNMTIMTDVPSNGTATSATLADKTDDGTVTVCGTSGSKGCLPATPNQRYCNPYRDMMNLSPERIDQGVDYGGGGPIYAIGPGTIDVYKNRNDAGWPGGTFVSYDVSAGPAMGKVVYLAENIDLNPALQQGSYVFSGTVLGTQVDASPQSESGWGVMGESITQEYSCYTEGCDTPLGDNFNSLLVCLNAPSGVSGTGGCCPAANGWPTDWCMSLSNWQ